MTSRKSLIADGESLLVTAGVDVSPLELEWLLMEAENLRRIDLVMDPETPVSADGEKKFRAFIDRRSRHEPVQHILGYAEFFGLRFLVNQDVLIPRPETELVVELALEFLVDRVNPGILDIGTGSGCIAISIAHRRPDARVSAIDISPAALVTAERNAALNQVRVAWNRADLYDSEMNRRLDSGIALIVSNPPYIPLEEEPLLAPEVREYDPRQALFPGEDHLKPYRALAALAADKLIPDGGLIVEVHEDWATPVAGLFRSAGLNGITTHADLAGRDRVVSARLEASDGV